MNRIAFLMPTFNRARYIAEALDAVTGQMGADDVVLVLDDGSTDDTPAVVEAYRPRVRYVRQDNRGKSAALNHALALTDSDFVWICDDDDVTAPGAVALLHDALATSDADFAFGRHTRFRDEASDGASNGGDTRVDLGTGYWPDLGHGTILRHLLEDSFVMQNATLIRRSALSIMGPFDESLQRSIDYDMFVRLALAVPGRFVDATVFAQRKHDGMRGPQGGLHAASSAMDVWAEWDRRVFDKVADTVPLGLFEGLFDGTDRQRRARAGLLQRACIWCRHHRWEAAIADLTAAAALAPTLSLHPVERAICSRMLDGKHGFAVLLGDGPVARDFAALLARSATARTMAWAMARGIAWRLRHHEPAERHAARAIIGRIARHTLGRGLVSGWRTHATPEDETALRERSEPFDPRAAIPMPTERPSA